MPSSWELLNRMQTGIAIAYRQLLSRWEETPPGPVNVFFFKRYKCRKDRGSLRIDYIGIIDMNGH